MNDSDKVNMTINIAGEHLKLAVDFDRQLAVRKTEKAVADLFDSWRKKWPSKSDQQILAMVAYQFASYYNELLDRHETAICIASDTLNRLDNALEVNKSE